MYGQRQFVEGYILQNGDTIKGFIHLREGSQTYQFCNFKKEKEREEVRYSPEDIDGYGYDNDRSYISASIKKEGGINERVFLQVYIRGSISLYRLDGGFVLKKENIFYSLKNSKELTVVDGEQYIQEKKEYLGIISFLTSDCRGYKRPIPLKKVGYSLEGIGIYIDAYNKCAGLAEESILMKKPLFYLSTGLSLSFNKQDFSVGQEFQQYLGNRLRTDITLGIGVPLHLYSPRLSNRYAFYAEPQFNKVSILNFNSILVNGNPNNFFADITYALVKIPFGLKYRSIGRLVKPSFGIGPAYNFIFNENQKWSKDTYYQNGIIQSEITSPVPLYKRYFSLWGSLGAEADVAKKIIAFIEFRFEYGNGPFDQFIYSPVDTAERSRSYQFTLGIKIR